MGGKPLACPWETYPTHRRDRRLQVNGERPIVYGYCAQTEDCSSCGGTWFKPNLRMEQGRSFLFVPCPFCKRDEYRKAVEKLRELLPKGSGPEDPLKPKPKPEPVDEWWED